MTGNNLQLSGNLKVKTLKREINSRRLKINGNNLIAMTTRNNGFS